LGVVEPNVLELIDLVYPAVLQAVIDAFQTIDQGTIFVLTEL
jgi:hypothetical protein